MAAGKNAVSSILTDAGWASVDADELAHEAIVHKTAEIIAAFSQEAEKAGVRLTKADGSLDRRALGSILFTDTSLLARQESIIYPEVNRLSDAFVASHAEKNVILNATVLYKIPDLMMKCSAVFYVTAPYLIRLIRAKKRDGMTWRQLFRRFRSQRKLYRLYTETGIPVITIRNTGSFSELRNETEAAVKQITKNT
jgi:dephospho-CoA kinase